MDDIEPAQAKGTTPIEFALKAYQPLQFCVLYPKLNAVTFWDSYPIPGMEECIESLGDAMIFLRLDANTSYCQVDFPDEDLHKSSFAYPDGLFRFIQLQFGLKTHP